MKSLPLAFFLLVLAVLIAAAYDLSNPIAGKADSKVISTLQSNNVLTTYAEKV